MRTLLNVRVAVMLSGILIGVLMIHFTEGMKQDQIRMAGDEVRRFQRQITFQATSTGLFVVLRVRSRCPGRRRRRRRP